MLLGFALNLKTAHGQQWSLSGNASTNPPTDFLGTTDSKKLIFKVNNYLSGLIDYHVDTANTSFGYKTLNSLTTGAYNAAFGYETLFSNTSGGANTAFGVQSLTSNTGAWNNSAYGAYSLAYNSSGNQNTGIGGASLYANTSGEQNSATGYRSLYSNTTGSHNTADGYSALYSNTTGDNNTAVGLSSLTSNTYGTNNTAVGYGAMNYNVTGDHNTGLGYRATVSINTTGLTNATVIGATAVIAASNAVMVGNTSVTSIGGYAGWTTFPSDGRVKKNVKTNVPGLIFINKLKPVTYTLDLTAIDNIIHPQLPKDKHGKVQQLSEIEIQSRNKKEKIVFTGFIAQEVESAAKSVKYDFSGVDVPENDEDPYGLRYAEFVVPLVKAVQELSSENEKQEKVIEELNNKVNQLQSQIDIILKGIASENKSLTGEQIRLKNTKVAHLEQNSPNPFNINTKIRYYLPETSIGPRIIITNENGQMLKTISIQAKGNGEVNINGRELTPGVYFYSLIVNGYRTDTKQMVITK